MMILFAIITSFTSAIHPFPLLYYSPFPSGFDLWIYLKHIPIILAKYSSNPSSTHYFPEDKVLRIS
jgi:hypothetical protein